MISPALPPPLLRVRGLSKTFPGLKALADVDLDVHAGEIVALVGQNGSGKSTLVKVLAGVHEADAGGSVEAWRAGGRVVQRRPGETRDVLHFIHQDLGLIESLSTVENFDILQPYGFRMVRPTRREEERRHAQRLVRDLGADIDVDAPASSLTPSERAIVAIARALDGWTSSEQVLVLDEPTAALHGKDVGRLFEAVRRVAERGAGILYISHRLDEVLDLADRVVALRDGRKVADVPIDQVDHSALVQMIVGRELLDATLPERAIGEPVLEVTGLHGDVVDGVDVTVPAGEVVGVTGVLGSGREELAGLVFGSTAPHAGEVRIAGSAVVTGNPRAAIAARVGFVPADRRGQGAVMRMSARENLTLPDLRRLRRRWGRLDRRAEAQEASDWVKRVNVRPPEPDRPLELFSGGNQQKIVLAKWLRNDPVVLLLDEPTQGVDVGAKAAVYDLIGRAAARGTGVLVCSSDTKELADLCDRVLVMDGGRVVDEISGVELTEERLVLESLAPPATGAGTKEAM